MIERGAEYLRYADLKTLGIVTNRMTLSRWIRQRNFPAGIKLSDDPQRGTRLWRRADVEAWLASRAAA